MIYSHVCRKELSWQFCTAAALGSLLAIGHVRADEGDTLNFIVGGAVRQEDNLFRLPSNVDPQLVVGKPTRSDQVRVNYAGVRLDKSYSQQKLHLDVTASTHRYQTFQSLNFDAFDYSGSFKWHLTQRVSGSLAMDHKQTQAGFATTTNYSGNNTVTTENRRCDLDWWTHGSWHLTGGVSEYKYRNSQLNIAEDSNTQRSTEVGVRYVAESGSSLKLLSKHSRGEYPGRQLNAGSLLDTGFRQTEAELEMIWLFSGKSSFSGRVTHLDRKHNNFSQRDYQGTAGRIDYTLTPTGKLQLKLSSARDIASYHEATNSYYVNNSIIFAPVWQVGNKTALRLSLERSQRDYLGGATAPPLVARQDHIRSTQLSLDWSPMRALVVTVSVQRDFRNSNYPNLGFVANTASVTAQLSF